MAETKSKKQPPKIADITKPGKTAPSSNARPMIITHRPVLRDPMMVQDAVAGDDNGEPSEERSTVTHMSHVIKLQPLHDDIKPEEDAEVTPGAPAIVSAVGAGKTIAVLAEEAAKRKAAKDEEEVDEADAEKPAEGSKVDAEPSGAPAVASDKIEVTKRETVTETVASTPELEEPDDEAKKPAEEKSAEPENTDENRSTGLPEEKPSSETTPAGPAHAAEEKPAETTTEPELPLGEDGDKPTEDDEPGDTNLSEADQKAANEAKKIAEEQEKIITSGKYYLPIDAVAHRRTKRHIVVGLVLILLLAAALFLAAWDANFFSIPGYTAPTDYL